jgi:hypothetical protein
MVRAATIRSSKIIFPAVVEVILRLSSMGTPPERSVAKVRVIREKATFRNNCPKRGILSIDVSMILFPTFVFLKCLKRKIEAINPRKMNNMYFWTKLLITRTTNVRKGISAPNSIKILEKTGTTFHIMKIVTTIEKIKTATG